MKKENSSYSGFYVFGIAFLFLAGFLLLVIFGAQSYQHTVLGQNGNMDSRAILSYISTTVKGYDTENAVSVAETQYGPALSIKDGSTGYALKIYNFNGNITEEYISETSELSPENGHIIGKSDIFEISLEGNSLRVGTDSGTVLLKLRSGGGK